MDDIRRQDTKLFIRELTNPWRLVMTFAAFMVVYFIAVNSARVGVPGLFVVLFVSIMTAWKDSIDKRFINRRMKALWDGCQDRMIRFEEVLKKTKKDKIADFNEMPSTIRSVAQSVYIALRRADIVSHEVMQSEKGMLDKPPVWKPSTHDAQSQELYRIADKNIAEYRQQFAGVMAGVQRTEAQSAVFMTTLDTLRMKMIGYRLVGRKPEMASQDFLEALAEARAQLQSIDTALEELDLGHYPKTISVVPPPPLPEDVRLKIEQGG
ncbi:MAG: hypothetical protein ACAH95_17525 [Fimbriimonas sp.]